MNKEMVTIGLPAFTAVLMVCGIMWAGTPEPTPAKPMPIEVHYPEEMRGAKEGDLLSVLSVDTLNGVVSIDLGFAYAGDMDTKTFPNWAEADHFVGVESRYTDLWCELAVIKK